MTSFHCRTAIKSSTTACLLSKHLLCVPISGNLHFAFLLLFHSSPALYADTSFLIILFTRVPFPLSAPIFSVARSQILHSKFHFKCRHKDFEFLPISGCKWSGRMCYPICVHRGLFNITDTKEPTAVISVKCKIKWGHFASFEGHCERSKYPELPVLMFCCVRVRWEVSRSSTEHLHHSFAFGWHLLALPQHSMTLLDTMQRLLWRSFIKITKFLTNTQWINLAAGPKPSVSRCATWQLSSDQEDTLVL